MVSAAPDRALSIMPVVAVDEPRLSDVEFCRRAMRMDLGRLGLSLAEVLRRTPPKKAV